jgi:flagellar basal body-associated protein FliL
MSENPVQEPTQENASISTPTDTILLEPQKSNRKTRKIVVIISIIGVIIIACIAIYGFLMYKAYIEKAPVEVVLNSYMQHMENKDTESAYALFSPRAQRQVPISALEGMLEGNYSYIFDDYQSLSVTNINFKLSKNSDPNVPQGSVATVNGTIDFEDNSQGSFDGVLEQVNGQWMIDGIHVSAPPKQ